MLFNEPKGRIVNVEYMKEPLDHLVHTLLTLVDSYEEATKDVAKKEIEEAMKEVNRRIKELGQSPFTIKTEV